MSSTQFPSKGSRPQVHRANNKCSMKSDLPTVRHITHHLLRSDIRVLLAQSLQKHSMHRKYRSVLRTPYSVMRQQAHIHTYLDQTERPAGPHRYISGPVASTRPVGFSTCQRNHVETYFFLLGYTIIKVERENTLFNLLESFLCIMSRQERTPVHFVQTVGKDLRIRISK